MCCVHDLADRIKSAQDPNAILASDMVAPHKIGLPVADKVPCRHDIPTGGTAKLERQSAVEIEPENAIG